MPSNIIENLDLEKPSFGPSKWPRKLKPAKNSKLPKLPENFLSHLEKVVGHQYPLGSAGDFNPFQQDNDMTQVESPSSSMVQ
jgi:hypothetical protein